MLSAPALAADYRDCKELFVAPLEVIAPATKSGGQPWDEGSAADPQLNAVPAERADVPVTIIGPKLQDTSSPRWNSIFVEAGQAGAWLPVRVGDRLSVALVDRDAFADDMMARYSVEVPKELATQGVAFVMAVADGGAPLFLRMSAVDGKRACAGIEAADTLSYVLPAKGLAAKVDSSLFAAIQEYNRCNVNGKSAACRPESYSALYADINQDGVTDTLVKGGPFDGGKAAVIALTLGFEPSKREQVFVGACEDLSPSKNGEVGCTSGGKTTLISVKGKVGAREASASEAEALSANAAEQRSLEAKTNLKALFTAQKALFGEKDRYSANAVELGFMPERGNRYAYFLAPRGEVQKRDGAQLVPQSVVAIIGPDTLKYSDAVLPKGLKEAGCPLSFGTNQDGEPVGLGVSGQGVEQHFIAYAVGNVDADADLDCWSISDIERKAKSGETIAAGEPFHERSDYDGKAVATPIP